jgi:hypothetical protein
LTRKKPKIIDEIFHELEEYIMSDDDHWRRVAERNEARKATKRSRGDLNSRIHETSITWKTLSPIRTIDQAQRRICTHGKGSGRGPPKLINHNPTDPYFYCQYHGRGHNTEGCPETKKNIARFQQEKAMMSIASSMPNQLRPSFWQPQFVNSQPKSSHNPAISATRTMLETFSAVLPSVAGN